MAKTDQTALRVRIETGCLEVNYKVDGIGRRVNKSIGAQSVRTWFYRNEIQISSELDENNNARAYFVYGSLPHVPDFMVMVGSNETYRFIHDQLGSIRMVVNATTGQIAQEIEYDEFGVVLRDTNPGFQPFGFAGGHYDHDTGLVHFGARSYDPGLGRWVSKDPILFEGGYNFYVYADSDPIDKIDTDGRSPRLVKVALDLVVWLIERRNELATVAIGLCTLSDESIEKCLELLGQKKLVPKRENPRSCDSRVQSCPQTKIDQLIKTKSTEFCIQRGK